MKVPGIRTKNHTFALATYLYGQQDENQIGLPLGSGTIKPWPEVAAYLAQNNLNVFSNNFPDSPLLDQHVESRKAFHASNVSMTIGKKNGVYGEVLAKRGNIDATWEMLPRRLLISNNSEQKLYLRTKIKGVYGVYLNIQSSLRDTRDVPLFGGTQNLFFQINKSEEMEITIDARAKRPNIEEFELRLNKLISSPQEGADK